ncbi:hypothetical protein H257_01666 [Aphanomyces astaci]|uniref:Uncharacterized protein n=1 Tax=Aphanomyces astaci TaxID=112090 RepID=W4H4E6_APHAT|nr:hypothetical protein H257_01666 [Aphanomyces astaci]ETV86481.1 hypothetical protein H257_01666 [Aphanomyces astaci]|eukprot:XP_009823280.1 hypothetical protein H257_01666 [Aphanomyces astaci]
MEIGSRIVTKIKHRTQTSPTRQRRWPGSSKQESTASLRPQSAKLHAKFLDLTLRPEKKKRGRPTTAKHREVKFSPEYPKRGQLYNDAILQREECLATIVQGCQEGGWRPGNDGISRILPLLAPLRLLSLAVVESILRWKVAADNRAFLWDGASYLHKMTSDTNVLDPFLSLELGFPMRRNPFMSSMALDTPQLTLLVCCPHKQQRTDDVVQCIARRLHFGTLEPGDMALNTRVISAMVAIVKEDMETQLDQEVMLGQTQHKASLDLDMSTISFEPDPEATVATIPTLKQQQQQQQRQPKLSAVYSPRDPRNDSATNTSKNSSSFRKLLHPVPTTNETLGRGTSDDDDDVHNDLQRIFSLCNDVSTAASQLKRQLHVLDTATKMDAPSATIFCALEPIPSYATSPLATPLRRRDLASPSSPIQSTPSPDIISANDDKLTSYIESLSTRIDRLRAFDVEAATDDDYKSLAIPSPVRSPHDDGTVQSPLSSTSLASPIFPKAASLARHQPYRFASLDKVESTPKPTKTLLQRTLAKHSNTICAEVPSSRSPQPIPLTPTNQRTTLVRNTSNSKRAPLTTTMTPASSSSRKLGKAIYDADSDPIKQAKSTEKATGDTYSPTSQRQPRTKQKNSAGNTRPCQHVLPDDASPRDSASSSLPTASTPREADWQQHRRKSSDHRMHCVAQHRSAVRLQAWWRHVRWRRSRYQHRRRRQFAVQTIENTYQRHRRRRQTRQREAAASVLQQWAIRRTALRRDWRALCHTKRRAVAGRSIQRSWRSYRTKCPCLDDEAHTTSGAGLDILTLVQSVLLESILDRVWICIGVRSTAAATIQSQYWTFQFNQQQASVLQRHHTPVIGVAAIPTTGHERCSSTIPGSNRGFIPPLQTKSQRDLQDQYADEGFESEGSARCDTSSTTPHDTRHDAATNAVHTDVKLMVMPYFILWMTNRLRCVQYRDLERRAKRERVRLAYTTWHDQSRRIVRVRTAFCGWRDQAQFEKDKRVQTRAEFAQSAKAWKQLQRGKHPSS